MVSSPKKKRCYASNAAADGDDDGRCIVKQNKGFES